MANYCKKIIILSQGAHAAAGKKQVSGIVKIERTAAELRCKAALFNLSSYEGVIIGIKCANMPLQQFSAGGGDFSLAYNSELNAPISCIAAYSDGESVLPIASGSTDKKGFSAAVLEDFVKNITYDLDKYSGAYKKSEAAGAAAIAATEASVKQSIIDSAVAANTVNSAATAVTSEEKANLAAATAVVSEEKAVALEEANASEKANAATRAERANAYAEYAFGQPSEYTPQQVEPRQAKTTAPLEKIIEPETSPKAEPSEAPVAAFEAAQAFDAPPDAMPRQEASGASIEIIEPVIMPEVDLAQSLEQNAGVTAFGIDDEIDDEVVATENYFEYEKEFKNKFKAERIMTKRMSDAFNFDLNGNDCRYYARVKDELEQLFSSYPAEDTLNGIIEDSNWVRINYKDDKYYAVGAIGYKNNPLYICYAVPAEYSPQPPTELEGVCQWLPKKYSDFTGDGYWIMYQDADTGDTIKDLIF
jgi:hypothetical protein